MAETKLYCATLDRTLLGGTLVLNTFDIVSPNRKLKIKSILFDWIAQEFVSGAFVPYEQNIHEAVKLSIGNYPASSKIGNSFTNGPIPWTTSGTQIHISKPGQYTLNSFFSANNIPFSLQIENTSGIVIRNFISITVEIEEKNIYQQ